MARAMTRRPSAPPTQEPVLVSRPDTALAASLSDDDIAFLTTGSLPPRLCHVRTTRMTVVGHEGRRETVATTRKTLPVHISTATMSRWRLFFLESLGLEPLVPVRASVADEEHLRVLGPQSRL